jgi:hypothetical protein
LLAVLLACVAAGLLGCTRSKAAPPGPGCYLDREAMTERIQRVLLMPLADEANCPTAAEGMTAALFSRLQDRQLFHVTMPPPADPSSQEPAIDPRRLLALKDLMRLRQASNCDAVFVGTVNLSGAYPRMQIGLSMRLVDLRDSRVLWAIENLWDAADRTTQARMADYFRRQRGPDYEPLDWRIAMVSPAAFQQFVAYEVTDTLPGITPIRINRHARR